MACGTCGTKDGKAKGCGNKGTCSTGGCNRLNTFDWLSFKDIVDPNSFLIHEISFKNGASKSFYLNRDQLDIHTGHWVVVDTGNGKDVGIVTLSGELARLQMKRKKVAEQKIENKIVRLASDRDISKMHDARALEKPSLVKARAIARSADLEMKIGDVQYQADLRKATFYYTADGRIDFRELVRLFASEFRVKIEMRQIGVRQESSRIGGIGSCGRELCCSTWLSEFKSVSTTAARYQNLAINQSKLSGQCGRLKCCLNYELDSYMKALEHFPKKVDKIYLEDSHAELVKMDIFKGIMYYALVVKGRRGLVVPIDKEEVKKIKEMNDNGEKPATLSEVAMVVHDPNEDETGFEFEDLTGVIELPEEKKKKRKNRNRNRNKNPKNQQQSRNPNKTKEQSPHKKSADSDNKPRSGQQGKSGSRRFNKNKKGQGPQKNTPSE